MVRKLIEEMKDFYYCLGYGLTPHSLDSDEKQVRFYHIVNELFKFAYGKRSAMGDEYDSQTEKNANIEKVLILTFLFFVLLIDLLYGNII
jgi:hypothetical protein